MNDSTEQGGTGGGFEDPTAPTWSTPDATQPLPTPELPVAPPSPYAPPQPYDTPAAPAPYGQPPYGQATYGQAPYGQAPFGQPPYAMPPAPYGAPPQKNTSAIVLTVISAVSLISCCNVLAIVPLVLGIVGLNRAGTDPQGAARSTKAGWITFAVTSALVVIGWVVFLALVGFGTIGDSTTYDYEGL